MDFVRINATSDGDNTVIAAPGAGKRIIVIAFALSNVTAVAGTITLRSGTAGTIHATFQAPATVGVPVVSFAGRRDSPAFICDNNTAFVLNNGGAGQDTSGFVTYTIEGA